jgi:hypothetical protein
MSSLLEVDSSFPPLDIADSTTAHSKRRALVWKHSRRLNQNENLTLLYCMHCELDAMPPPYSTNLARNLTKHIKRHHKGITLEKALSKNQEAVNEQIRQLYRQAQASGDTEDFDLEVLESCLNPAVITKALVTLIVIRNLSYAIVEWPEFHTLCQVLNIASEGKITTSHSIVATKVKEA